MAHLSAFIGLIKYGANVPRLRPIYPIFTEYSTSHPTTLPKLPPYLIGLLTPTPLSFPQHARLPPYTRAEDPMLQFNLQLRQFVGAAGTLHVPDDDEITRKLAMLIEGECQGLGPLDAARKFGFSKQRYFQLRHAFSQRGALALHSQKRGPKRPSRRTDEVVRQVIRHRFLDPEASAEVIAQKLRQSGWTISARSVERIIAHFGLQKKTPSLPTGR